MGERTADDGTQRWIPAVSDRCDVLVGLRRIEPNYGGNQQHFDRQHFATRFRIQLLNCYPTINVS